MLIQTQPTLNSLCRELQNSTLIGFDTEFIREKRYYPQLCLVQVCGADGSPLELIDPFRVDLKPFAERVADPAQVKVVHSGSQDLQILYQMFGSVPRNVFDTQIAAAFLGFGHQIGYADLVNRALGGPILSKGSQYTDWSARPLSPAQMEYALADVRYLPALYHRLTEQLEKRERLHWAQAEFRRAEQRATVSLSGRELYRRLSPAGLSRRQLANLRELAEARDRLAESMDRPPAFILSDPVLIQIARQPPHSEGELRTSRGVGGLSREHAASLMDALRRAAALPPEEYPEPPRGERPSAEAGVVSSLLSLVAQARAAEHDVSKSYLAPGDQIAALAEWWVRRKPEDPPLDIDLLSDWRRDLLGNELLELLSGRLAVGVNPRWRRGQSVLQLTGPGKTDGSGEKSPRSHSS